MNFCMRNSHIKMATFENNQNEMNSNKPVLYLIKNIRTCQFILRPCNNTQEIPKNIFQPVNSFHNKSFHLQNAKYPACAPKPGIY